MSGGLVSAVLREVEPQTRTSLFSLQGREQSAPRLGSAGISRILRSPPYANPSASCRCVDLGR